MYVRSYIQRSHGKCGELQEQGGIVHDIITTQVIFMASKYTVIDITSSKCRFRDTVDNPNVRILVLVETIFTSLKIVHVLWCGTVDVRNIWTAEAKLRFVIQCQQSLSVLKGHSGFS